MHHPSEEKLQHLFSISKHILRVTFDKLNINDETLLSLSHEETAVLIADVCLTFSQSFSMFLFLSGIGKKTAKTISQNIQKMIFAYFEDLVTDIDNTERGNSFPNK